MKMVVVVVVCVWGYLLGKMGRTHIEGGCASLRIVLATNSKSPGFSGLGHQNFYYLIIKNPKAGSLSLAPMLPLCLSFPQTVVFWWQGSCYRLKHQIPILLQN